MSPAQMARHLIDAFHVALGEKETRWPSNIFNRTVVKWIVLYMPFHWPRNVPGPDTTLAPAHAGTPLPDAINELERIIHRFVLSKRGNAMLPHPFFGPLTDAQWNRWGYLHADHHLRQFGL